MHEYDFGFSLPKGYQVFLDDLGDQPGYDIGETGICLYAKEDLTERIKPTRLMRMNQISL